MPIHFGEADGISCVAQVSVYVIRSVPHSGLALIGCDDNDSCVGILNVYRLLLRYRRID